MGQGTDEIRGTEKATDRLHLEILQTEAEMSDTIHEIEDRLSPAELKRRAVEKIKSVATAGVERVKRQGPSALAMPAAVAAAGIGLLFLVKGRKNKRQVMVAVVPERQPEPSGKRSFGYGAIGLAVGAAMALLLPKTTTPFMQPPPAGRPPIA